MAGETSSSHELRLIEALYRRCDDDSLCPLSSGVPFFEWLSLGLAELKCPVPDTFVSSTSTRVRSLQDESHTVVTELIDSRTQSSIDDFLLRFCRTCLSQSASSKQQSTTAEHRIVAVAKTSMRQGVFSFTKTDPLLPLSLQARMTNCLEQPAANVLLQQFIKSRGSRAGFYRVQYLSSRDDSGSTQPCIKGWTVSNAASTEPYTGARDDKSDPIATVEQLSEYMRMHPHMEPAKRALYIGQANDVGFKVGDVNLCSLSDNGRLSSERSRGIVVCRLQTGVLEELKGYAAAVLRWIQAVVYKKHGLLLSLSSVTCDFIRDDTGKWWLIALRTFRLTDVSRDRVTAWHRMSSEEVREGGDGEESSAVRKVKLKLEQAGRECRMCGVYYRRGQTLIVDKRAGGKQHAEATGYVLTSRIATVLAEVYRDNGVPLTETAQLLLLARANSTSSRVRLGTIPCCFYCAEVCERYRSYLHASDDFLDTLGVPLQSVVGTEAPGAQRGLSGGGASGVGVEPVQWRVMLLFRSFIDVSANAIALDGRTYCLSYTLGSRVSSVAFTPVQESSPSVLGIKHCRLHYVFGSRFSLREWFSKERIRVHVFCRDSRAAPDVFEPMYDGFFEVSLERLRWLGLADGSEKIDITAPVHQSSLGNVSVLMSIAVAMDAHVSPPVDRLAGVSGDVFWPPPSYCSRQLLPTAWLAMFT